jgi:LmbE family N-acetylglucosaminyl deacetylase
MPLMATIVAFHAHPDDEAILTGGTLARLAAEGHRVVIVVACDGTMWDSDGTRLTEFRRSAAILGAARAEHLGYADSGSGPVLFPDPPARTRFARADLDEAAGLLIALLRSENADLLLSYDAIGCDGHPDHVKVHEVGALAGQLTEIRVLEATVPRHVVFLAVAMLGALRLVVRVSARDAWSSYGTPRQLITHRVRVRRYASVKHAALVAHMTPANRKGRASRLLRLAAALPIPVIGWLPGVEWFIEPGAVAGHPVLGDVLVPAPKRS